MVRGSSINVLCPVYLLLIAAGQALLICVAGRTVERRRHIVEFNAIRHSIGPKIGFELAPPPAEKSKGAPVDKHCWISVTERGQKAVDVHGTCVQLGKGTFACQNQQFMDPHNIFCKFLDQ
ncbi:hypothetical protein niasHT_039800 [Heterodera trifolii]|uniref:Secreted protein n=1 Tax=Heterodera trifolii TaxID=157864 RepID=A0ABD2IYN8_9BILA